MPRGTKNPRAAAPELPGTLQRSERHAQDIWMKAHDSAVETYGEGRRAHMVAYAALKHSYEKRGDRWVPRAEKGPSDPQTARGPTSKPSSTSPRRAPTAGGEAAREGGRARREYAREHWRRILRGGW